MAEMGTAGTSWIRRLNKKRDEEKKKNEEKIKVMREKATEGLSISDKFSTQSESVDEALSKETHGLVSKDEFKKRREQIIREREVQESMRQSQQKEAKEKKLNKKEEEKARKRKKEKKKASQLSFDIEDEIDTEEPPLKKRLGKDPSVRTDFLPDVDRDKMELEERARLREEWLAEQQRIKDEVVGITYSYWDGTGHRRTTQVKKGTTVYHFLREVQKEFKDLQKLSTDDLMFIKEDLIIPTHYSFYDFIVTKARGKSGPLFDFGAQDDVRLLADATQEKNETHAAKVVLRHWYERNKHIFPASRWEVYDPEKDYGSYTIHGGEVDKAEKI